jgi:hypothetical protein
LAQATRKIDQVKDEAGTRIENVKMDADTRVNAVETEAKKRVDAIRRENEDKVLRLEADLTQARDRADRAEQRLMLVRRGIEDHLMPAMRDGPNPTNSAVRPRSFRLSRSSARTWFGRLWLRAQARLHSVVESARISNRRPLLTEPLQHESGFSNDPSVRKTGNTAIASEPTAPLRSDENSAALSSVTAG